MNRYHKCIHVCLRGDASGVLQAIPLANHLDYDELAKWLVAFWTSLHGTCIWLPIDGLISEAIQESIELQNRDRSPHSK